MNKNGWQVFNKISGVVSWIFLACLLVVCARLGYTIYHNLGYCESLPKIGNCQYRWCVYPRAPELTSATYECKVLEVIKPTPQTKTEIPPAPHVELVPTWDFTIMD